MPELANPACPRCAYDLSGFVESWQSACPLDGTCSECGLRVQWRDVLNPSYSIPPWSFEHAVERRPAALRETRRRALWPSEFWQSLRMEHRVCARRLAALFLANLLILTLAAGLVSALGRWSLTARTPGPLPFWRQFDFANIDLGTTLWLVFMPYLPIGSPWTFSVCFTRFVFGFLAMWPMFTAPAFLVLGQTLTRCRVRRAHLLRGVAYSLVYLPLPAMISVAATVVTMHGRWFGGGWECLMLATAMHAAAIALLGFSLSRYWYHFCKTYLQLPHVRSVVVAMMLMGALASITALYAMAGLGLARDLGQFLTDCGIW